MTHGEIMHKIMLVREVDQPMLSCNVLHLIHCEYKHLPSVFYVLMQDAW